MVEFYLKDSIEMVSLYTEDLEKGLKMVVHGDTGEETTLNSTYNEKKYAKILLHYRRLFVKGDIFIAEWGIFGADIFLCYSQFFVKGNCIIARVECM